MSLEVEFELTSCESILKMLQSVAQMKICTGSGLDKARQVIVSHHNL